MLKLFALLSVLLFVFKALAETPVDTSVRDRQEIINARKIELQKKERNYSKKCINKTTDGCPSLKAEIDSEKADIKRAEDANLGIAQDPDKGKNECREANNKYSESYRNFLRDQKDGEDKFLREKKDLTDDARTRKKECTDKVAEIEKTITELNEDLNKTLEELEAEAEAQKSELTTNLENIVQEALNTNLEIRRVFDTEKFSVENSYNAAMAELITKCEESINAAKEAARKLISERKKARNAGILRQRSTMTSFSSNTDQDDAKEMVERTEQACKRQEQVLKNSRDLQFQTLNDKLAQLETKQSILKNNISKLEQELQNQPNKSMQKKVQTAQRFNQKIEAQVRSLSQQRIACQQIDLEVQAETRQLVQTSTSNGSEIEPLLADFDSAHGACCGPVETKNRRKQSSTSVRSIHGPAYSSLCQESRESVRRRASDGGR